MHPERAATLVFPLLDDQAAAARRSARRQSQP